MGQYSYQTGYKKSHLNKFIFLSSFFSVIVLGLGVFNYLFVNQKTVTPKSQSIPVVNKINQSPAVHTDTLQWPVYGQAAYGIVEKGVLAESKDAETPVPVASLAKVITALAVLEKKPLDLNQAGETITFTTADEELYRRYLAMNGTVTPVKAGASISQYQALQSMLMTDRKSVV